MKRVWIIISIILAVILIGLICFQIYFINSPTYGLMQIRDDVKASGLDGLRPHLMGDALETYENILAIKENKVLGLLALILSQTEYVRDIATNLDSVKFDLKKLDRDGDHAAVTLHFQYEDRLEGTVDLTMVKTDDGWKVNDLAWPNFTKVSW